MAPLRRIDCGYRFGFALDAAAKYLLISTWLMSTLRPGNDGAVVFCDVTCTVLWQAKQLFCALCACVKVSTVVFDSWVEPVSSGVPGWTGHSSDPGWNVQFGFSPLVALNQIGRPRNSC